MSTLGAAAYLDCPGSGTPDRFIGKTSWQTYLELARRNNILMLKTFDDLYEELLSHLSGVIEAEGKPVKFSKNKALPGFHIYKPHPAYAIQATHVPHFDLPYLGLDWNKETKESSQDLQEHNQCSFTLTLQLPACGGGLRLWPVKRKEAMAMEKTTLRDRLSKANSKLHDYSVGSLLIHSGQELHQIAPWHAASGDLARITLQGHGIELEDSWIIYW
jgi:hypothetical protein